MSTPSSWNEAPLSMLCRAVGGGTPPRGNASYWKGHIPWASVKDFKEDSIHLCDTEEHISNEGLLNSASNLIPPNTPLICTRMAVGRCALSVIPIAINQDVKALVDLAGLEPEFLVRALALRGRELDRIAIGSTVKGISTEQLLGLQISYPDIDEQTRIANVLNTIEAAIEQTDALVAKLTQIRAGVLREFFSCGIGDDGRLRGTLTNPSQFKDAIFGRMPSSWKVLKFRDACSKVGVGIATGATSYFVNRGVPMLRNQNITEQGITLDDVVQISPAFADANRTKRLEAGDIITARTGYPGLSAVVTEREAGWQTFTTLISRPKQNDFLPTFLALQINSPVCKSQIACLQAGGAQQNLNSRVLETLNVIWMPKQEQEQIVVRIKEIDNGIDAQKGLREKLLLLKLGVAVDVLTGHVRVPAELEMA